MSWYGKFWGGAFGFLMAGPLGAVFGAAIGHQLDQNPEQVPIQTSGRSSGEHEEILRSFIFSLFRLMGYIAKADGRVSEAELWAVRGAMHRIILPPKAKLTSMRLFNEGKQDSGVENALAPMLVFAHSQPQLVRLLISLLTEVALADGAMDPRQERAILAVCERLGFSRYEFFGIWTRLEVQLRFTRAQKSHYEQHHDSQRQENQHRAYDHPFLQTTPLLKAFATLGVDPSSSRLEVKKAYRQKMSQHHPDKQVARGVSGERLKQTTETAQQVQAAYDLIIKSARFR